VRKKNIFIGIFLLMMVLKPYVYTFFSNEYIMLLSYVFGEEYGYGYSYVLTYDYNGATSGNSTASKSVTYNSTYGTLPSPGRSYTYTVNYDSQGGSSCTAQSTTRTDTFGGWYNGETSNNGSGTQITASTKVSTASNHTIYAKWTSNNAAAITLPTPTKTGYTFSGWYTAASGGTKIGGAGGSYIPTGTITLYAHWTANSYTVTYDYNGATSGNGTASKSVTYDSTYGTLPSPGRSYTYTVNYDSQGGSSCTAQSTTRTDTFNGWYNGETSDNGSGTQVTESTIVSTASDHTLYAKWTSNNALAITLPSPTKEGYIFNGWYTESTGGTKIGDAGGSYIPTQSITMYAQWSMKKYEITATVGSNGKILPGTVLVGHGYDQTFYIIPNNGYEISDVKVDNVSVDAKTQYTFKNVKASHTISATFVAVSTPPEVNKPAISEEMIPVIWEGSTWEIVNPTDSRWYNYSTGKWANVMLRDGMNYIDNDGSIKSVGTIALAELVGKKVDSSNPGSALIWIPRYSYKINGESIDIKWSKDLTDYTLEDYNLHPAFRYARYNGGDTATAGNYSSGYSDKTGIWVAKYEAKNVSSAIKISESGTRWTNIDVGTAFSTAQDMIGQSQYNLSTTYFESHLMKNVEWGAIAYLQKYINTTSIYDIKDVDKTSGRSEYVASYNELVGGTINYNVRQNGSSLVSAAEKFVDVVKITKPSDTIKIHNSYKEYLGNAIGETSTSGTGNTSFNNETSAVPVDSTPFVARTGRFGYTGVSGAANASIGFRPVIVLKSVPTRSKYNVSVLQNCTNGSVSGVNQYTSDSTVTLTATPAYEFKFTGWQIVSGGVTLSSTTSATTTFTMPSTDVTILAKFEGIDNMYQ